MSSTGFQGISWHLIFCWTVSASLGAAYLRQLHLLLFVATSLLLRVLCLGLEESRVPRQQLIRVWTNLNVLGEGEETGHPCNLNNGGESWLTTSVAYEVQS